MQVFMRGIRAYLLEICRISFIQNLESPSPKAPLIKAPLPAPSEVADCTALIMPACAGGAGGDFITPACAGFAAHLACYPRP